MQYLRAKKSTELLDENTVIDQHIDCCAEHSLQQRDIEQAMKILSVIERHCITLQFSFGYTQEEIALLTELPLGTVKSHVKRGKEKLAEYFESSLSASQNQPPSAYTGAA